MAQFDPRALASIPQDINASFQQGYGLADQISNAVMNRDRARQESQGMQSFMENPSQENAFQQSMANPGIADQIKSGLAQMDSITRQKKVNETIPLYAALLSGRADIAAKRYNKLADDLEKAGGDQAQIDGYRMRAEQVINAPDEAKYELGAALAGALGHANFTKSFGDLIQIDIAKEKAPFDNSKILSEANKNNAEAGLSAAKLPTAEAMAQAELEAKQMIPQDIMMDNQTNQMNAITAAGINSGAKEEQKMNLETQRKLREAKDFYASISHDSPYGKDIEKLIQESTGSYIGNLTDIGARAFKLTTSGMKAISALGSKANEMVQKMPRAPGNPTETEMQMAKDMAGDINNPNKTPGEKLAAFDGLRKLYQQNIAAMENYSASEQQVQEPLTRSKDAYARFLAVTRGN